MANYRLSKKADEDLSNLYRYGVLEHGVAHADAYFFGLLDRLNQIADQPRLYQDVSHIAPGYRRSVYGVQTIYYTAQDDGVIIMRILGRQNPDTAL